MMDACELLLRLWRSKGLVLLIVGGGILLGGLSSLLLKDRYDASTVAVPVLSKSSSGSMGGLGALASQYSGLASLAGISLGAGGGDEEAVALLKSDTLARDYIERNGLMKVLYAEMWDTHTGKWRVGRQPTLWDGVNLFSTEVRRVARDRETGLVTLTIRWTNPELAAQWANGLVSLVNERLKGDAVRESQRNIAYLSEQVSHTGLLDTQRVIYSLLEQEINKEMLANGKDEYALKVIDPAYAPEFPSTPGLLLLASAGFAIGLCLAVLIVLARSFALDPDRDPLSA